MRETPLGDEFDVNTYSRFETGIHCRAWTFRTLGITSLQVHLIQVWFVGVNKDVQQPANYEQEREKNAPPSCLFSFMICGGLWIQFNSKRFILKMYQRAPRTGVPPRGGRGFLSGKPSRHIWFILLCVHYTVNTARANDDIWQRANATLPALFPLSSPPYWPQPLGAIRVSRMSCTAIRARPSPIQFFCLLLFSSPSFLVVFRSKPQQ